MEYYRRHLPHIHPRQATYFITFRLVNSLPRWIIEQLQNDFELERLMDSGTLVEKEVDHHRYFEKFDKFLDAQKEGNRWLSDPRVASVVAEAIVFRDGLHYDLLCYCIMPNHVHILFRINDEHLKDRATATSNLTKILQSLKSYTAVECNRVLGRKGQFWQRESYDRVVRNEQELERTIRYIIFNPIAAGLVADWKDWNFTYSQFKIE